MPSEVDDKPDRFEKFRKMDATEYDRMNDFLSDKTTFTAREWAIARLCADFRTETGVKVTAIGENLPDLVPFMTDEYSPQAVQSARDRFEEKVRLAAATFLYGAMCDFFTADELDEIMYEATETAKYLLELEGAQLGYDEEIDAEERVGEAMREVRAASRDLRGEEG